MLTAIDRPAKDTQEFLHPGVALKFHDPVDIQGPVRVEQRRLRGKSALHLEFRPSSSILVAEWQISLTRHDHIRQWAWLN